MKITRVRKDNYANSAIEVMASFIPEQDDAKLGPFWYDPNKSELFGVMYALADDCLWYHSTQFNTTVRTHRVLHSAIWKKNHYKGDPRFRGDYTQVPRGRVFEFQPEESEGDTKRKFVVFVGNWINKYPQAKNLILLEFDLSADETEFRIDSHWDIGHGWSDEF